MEALTLPEVKEALSQEAPPTIRDLLSFSWLPKKNRKVGVYFKIVLPLDSYESLRPKNDLPLDSHEEESPLSSDCGEKSDNKELYKSSNSDYDEDDPDYVRPSRDSDVGGVQGLLGDSI